MAPHSSTLAWKIPWTGEPGRLQSRGLLRVGHDWETSLSLFTFLHRRRKWQPTPVFLPGESQGRGAWWAAVYEVAQSQTWLTQLSSSSSVRRALSPFYRWCVENFRSSPKVSSPTKKWGQDQDPTLNSPLCGHLKSSPMNLKFEDYIKSVGSRVEI